MHEGVEQRVAEKAAPGQYPGKGDGERQAEPDAASRHAQAQMQRLDFARAQPHHFRFTRCGASFVRTSILCTPTILRICSMTYYRAVAHADAVPAAPERIGVLAVNLGTPDSPSYWAVQRYLR